MKKNTKSGTRPQEIPRGSLHMRRKPAPKILQGNALEVPKESVSVITLTEEVPASLIDWHCCCSVTKSCLTLCDLIGLQQARLPCPSSPRACSNSCPLSQWCHPTISSSVAPSPPALNLSLHQGLSQWVNSWHQVILPLIQKSRFLSWPLTPGPSASQFNSKES